jgi:integrase/recombinase XerD
VVRQDGPVVNGADWLPEGPEWLRQGVRAWLKHQWGVWKPSQRRHHAQARLRQIRPFWEWQLNRRELSGWGDLTREDIAGFIAAELDRGLKEKTVKTSLDSVYQLLRYLVDEGQLAKLPERPAIHLPDGLPRELSPQEVLSLEAEVARRESRSGESDRLGLALYYLLAHGGLRISEALDLKVEDLDLVGRRVRVRDGKGRKDRVVYLTVKATAVLGGYLDTVPHAPEDLVLSHQGKALRYEEAWTRIHCLGQAAGIAGLSPHRLRHTYATHLLNHGVTIDALRRLMGHENLNTTLIYARLADTTLESQYRAAMESPPVGAGSHAKPTTANYV